MKIGHWTSFAVSETEFSFFLVSSAPPFAKFQRAPLYYIKLELLHLESGKLLKVNLIQSWIRFINSLDKLSKATETLTFLSFSFSLMKFFLIICVHSESSGSVMLVRQNQQFFQVSSGPSVDRSCN